MEDRVHFNMTQTWGYRIHVYRVGRNKIESIAFLNRKKSWEIDRQMICFNILILNTLYTYMYTYNIQKVINKIS